MSFISVFIPAVIIAFGCMVCMSSMSSFERGTTSFRMMLAAGVCLCLAGLWLEFFVSQVCAARLILKVLVVLASVAGVVAVSVAKDNDVEYYYNNNEVNVYQTAFKAKAFGVVCAVMTLVLSSLAAGN